MASLRQKYGLLKGLCNGERAVTGPFYATLDVTSRCNLRCRGCRFHSTESDERTRTAQGIRDFPFDWAERLFSEFKELKTRTLFLMGEGEPFLHPRVIDIIRLAKKYGMHTTVTTNGTLIDETKAGHIVDAGLDEIHISLWASSPAGYEKHYPGTDPVNFQRVVDGMKILSSLKAQSPSRNPRIVLSNPINCFNYQGIEEMVALAAGAGCDAISFTPFKTNRGNLTRYALSGQQQTELCDQLVRLRKPIKAHSMGNNMDRVLARYTFDPARHDTPCYIHWFHSRIKVDGTVFSCGRSELALGSLQKESFTDIWNGAAYRMERRKMLSPGGPAHRKEICDCEFCSYVQDNMKIHKGFKYAMPVLAVLGKGPRGATAA